MKAPAYSLNDAPAAFRRALKRYLLNSELYMKCVGLGCQAPTFDPCLFFAFRAEGQAVGAFATHIDDILGCGKPDILTCFFFGQRFGELKLREELFVHVGMELAFSATLTRRDFAGNLRPLGTSPEPGAARQKLSFPGRRESVTIQAWGTLPVGDCFSPGYLCKAGPNR